jgi:hypothetical protein
MPMMPHSPERTAPIRNPNAVGQPSAGTKPMIRNRTAPTIATVVYCRRRYAVAPWRTAAAISCMRALPCGNAMIRRMRKTP